jgi:hypothetical protein
MTGVFAMASKSRRRHVMAILVIVSLPIDTSNFVGVHVENSTARAFEFQCEERVFDGERVLCD